MFPFGEVGVPRVGGPVRMRGLEISFHLCGFIWGTSGCEGCQPWLAELSGSGSRKSEVRCHLYAFTGVINVVSSGLAISVRVVVSVCGCAAF